MYFTILAYHEEEVVASRTPQEDATLMAGLLEINDRLTAEGRLGPAGRLDMTGRALTLRGPGAGTVTDGPFAETKEQLLGFYVVDCASPEEAVQIARDLRRVNSTAVYEIRPVKLYLPGAPLPASER